MVVQFGCPKVRGLEKNKRHHILVIIEGTNLKQNIMQHFFYVESVGVIVFRHNMKLRFFNDNYTYL